MLTDKRNILENERGWINDNIYVHVDDMDFHVQLLVKNCCWNDRPNSRYSSNLKEDEDGICIFFTFK